MNARYHFKPHELLRRAEPAELGLDYTSARRYVWQGPLRLHADAEEVCLVVLDGVTAFECAGQAGTAGPKDLLYLPPGMEINLSAPQPCVMMRLGAPSDLRTSFAYLGFAQADSDPARHKIYGKAETNCRRHVWNIIDEGFASSRFLVGFCGGAAGGWTAWPPHEHAEKREEVYVYFDMDKAFGIQCVYEDMDNPLVVAMVRDGDLVSVPRGYHPSVGCPAGRIFYLYCMVAKKPGERSFMDLHIQEIYGDRFE